MIRVYGCNVGYGSFARVSAGVRHGLSEYGKLAGFVPVDSYDSEEPYVGAEAPVGLLIGPPTCASMMSSLGAHRIRLALISPNSTWVPSDMLRTVEKHVTGFVTPSKWGKNILKNHTNLPVHVYQHGVDEHFTSNVIDYYDRRSEYEHGQFRVAHLSSTDMGRKGTLELIDAWRKLLKCGFLCQNPFLTMVVNDYSDALKHYAKDVPCIEWVTRINMPVPAASEFYRKYHMVVAPSRGEAFGMVPLEARACGIPVVATSSCTGHAEHMDERQAPSGVVRISVGKFSPIDDGHGAMAPSLHWQDIHHSLAMAYRAWPILSEMAHLGADSVRSRWSWASVTKRFLDLGILESTT